MVPREEIADDWRDWKARRLAWALEAHLLPVDDYSWYSPPAWLQKMLDENDACEQPYPMGLGHHKKTGYFVLVSAGQGPCICGIENDPPPPRPSRPEVAVRVEKDDDEFIRF